MQTSNKLAGKDPEVIRMPVMKLTLRKAVTRIAPRTERLITGIIRKTRIQGIANNLKLPNILTPKMAEKEKVNSKTLKWSTVLIPKLKTPKSKVRRTKTKTEKTREHIKILTKATITAKAKKENTANKNQLRKRPNL